MILRAIVFTAAALSLFACASTASSTADDQGASTDQAATTTAASCGASEQVALGKYKEAVATAKQL